ncbi:hypothetical protein NKH77_13725 [Streptomyces sp. M19]
MDFVEFMTSDEEQRILNAAYGSVSPVTGARDDRSFAAAPARRVMRDTLAASAAPLPRSRTRASSRRCWARR